MNFIHRANSSHIHLTFVPLFNRRLAFPRDEICVWDLFAICHSVGVRKRERNVERIYIKKKKMTVVDRLWWHEHDIDAILICVSVLLFLRSGSSSCRCIRGSLTVRRCCDQCVQQEALTQRIIHLFGQWSQLSRHAPALSCYTSASFHAQLPHNHDIISINQLTSLRCLLFPRATYCHLWYIQVPHLTPAPFMVICTLWNHQGFIIMNLASVAMWHFCMELKASIKLALWLVAARWLGGFQICLSVVN